MCYSHFCEKRKRNLLDYLLWLYCNKMLRPLVFHARGRTWFDKNQNMSNVKGHKVRPFYKSERDFFLFRSILNTTLSGMYWCITKTKLPSFLNVYCSVYAHYSWLKSCHCILPVRILVLLHLCTIISTQWTAILVGS